MAIESFFRHSKRNFGGSKQECVSTCRARARHVCAWHCARLTRHAPPARSTSIAGRDLLQNFSDLARMALAYGASTLRFKGSLATGHSYEQPTKRQAAEKRARDRGKEMAGRVRHGPMEAYCNAQLDVWTVLHKDTAQLGQRVTRLQDRFFCDCVAFVMRAMHCRHICAVVVHEAGLGHGAETTLHLHMRPHAKVRERSGRPRAAQQRHLAEGTRVLVKTDDGACQVGVAVGNTYESCDVQLGEHAPPTRVPLRSILEWVTSDKPGAVQQKAQAAALGTTFPFPGARASASRPQKRKRQLQLCKKQAKGPDADAPGIVGPMAIRWGLTCRDRRLTNTCPYDAIFAPLVHLLASDSAIQAFTQSRMASSPQLRALHDVCAQFWNGHSPEVRTAVAGWMVQDPSSVISSSAGSTGLPCVPTLRRLAWRICNCAGCTLRPGKPTWRDPLTTPPCPWPGWPRWTRSGCARSPCAAATARAPRRPRQTCASSATLSW
jgi:hypothetical protein